MGNSAGCLTNLLIVFSTLLVGILNSLTAVAPIDAVPDTTDYPFEMADGGVSYSFRETLNCQVIIAGNVEFLNENATDHKRIVIMLQPLGTYDERTPAIVNIGSDTSFGDRGWSQLLVGNYWYLVWLQDLASNIPLSPEILVDNLDCANERTLAQVNFRQIQPY